MNNTTNVCELAQVVYLMSHINSHYAAEVEDFVDWEHREWVITIDEGGRTIYAVTIEMDAAIEAKCRLVREELEQMVAECSLPIRFKGAA